MAEAEEANRVIPIQLQGDNNEKRRFKVHVSQNSGCTRGPKNPLIEDKRHTNECRIKDEFEARIRLDLCDLYIHTEKVH